MSPGTRAVAALGLLAGCAAAVVSVPAAAEPPAPTRALARLEAPPRTLVRARPIAVPGGGSIDRYQQRIAGLPVLGATATFATPAGADPLVVSDHTVAGLARPALATLSRRAAIAAAEEAGAVERARGRARATLAIEPEGGRTVWRVSIPSAEPFADLLVLIDARSGAVLRVRDLLKHATGTATVFNPNPVVTQGTYAGLRDADDRDSLLLTSLRQPVTLERLTSTSGCLTGEYVDVRIGIGKRAKEVCSAGFDFRGVTRSLNAFEAVMAYYHVDRTRAYVESLGLSKGLRGAPQRVNVNAILEDNSYFSPLSRRLTFGTGGVDDAEDADVIVHEYGHSLQDQAARLFGEAFEGAAMGEGFADYLAAIMSVPLSGGNPRFDACMFEWDATSYTNNACGRRTDTALTKQKGLRSCQDSVHCLGRAWSGALWELRGALGTDVNGLSVADRVVFESHFMLDSSSEFIDGARALIAADRLLYASANVPTLEAEMVQRGFCKRSGC